MTFSAVVPVSRVSPGPCDNVAGSAAGVPDDGVTADGVVVDDEPVVAAFAIPAPPIAAPRAAALTISQRPRFGVDLDCDAVLVCSSGSIVCSFR